MPSPPLCVIPFEASLNVALTRKQISFLAEGPQQAETRAVAIAAKRFLTASQVGSNIIQIIDLLPCSWSDFYALSPQIKPGWGLPEAPNGFTTACALTADSPQISLDWTRHQGDFASDHDDLRGLSEIEWPFLPACSPPRLIPTETDWLTAGIVVR